MIYLGINGGFGGGYQDAAACFMRDGKILFAAEEERFSRVKFSPSVLPLLSLQKGIEYLRIKSSDISHIALHGEIWQGNKTAKVAEYLKRNFGISGEIHFYNHHLCHAAASYYASALENALVITMDSSGDGISTQISKWNASGYEILKTYTRPQSLGFFYSLITQYCGFRRDADEYKLMGLAPYSKSETLPDISFLLKVEKGQYHIDNQYLNGFVEGTPAPDKQESLWNSNFEQKLGFPPRIPGTPMDEKYIDLAKAAQAQLEQVFIELISHWTTQTGLKNVCLGGGVALNCSANMKVEQTFDLDAYFIPPFTGDQGITIGAAYLASFQNGISPQKETSPYLGKSYSYEEIRQALINCKVSFMELENLFKGASELLSKGKIIAWHQGRSEIGPRALGNRSILAYAGLENVKDKINAQIKFREAFRPFCPAVLEEDFQQYFESKHGHYPYMNINVGVKESAKQLFPEIAHIDGSARVQTVSESENSSFYHLLKELKTLTGHGLLLNTSFNVRNHPIVETPYDALECFFASGLDALIIDRFLLLK